MIPKSCIQAMNTERGCVRGKGAPAAAAPNVATCCGWSSTHRISEGGSWGGLYQNGANHFSFPKIVRIEP